MKKIFVALFLMWKGIELFALPVGNPSEASALHSGILFDDTCGIDCCSYGDFFSLRTGFYGDYVFERNLRRARKPNKYISISQMHTNAGYIAANFCERVDLFTSLGVSNISLDFSELLFSPIAGADTGILTTLNTKTDFSWSIGGRATLFEWCGLAFGVEGQYFRFNPKKIKYINPLFVQTNTDGTDYNFRYHEWQVGAGFSYRLIDSVLPYCAVKYSNARVKVNTITDPDFFDGPFTFSDLKLARHWGGALGVLITACDCMALTVEGRFYDENALYVNAQLRF